MLYRYLGWEEVMPEFAHLPLLLKPEGNGKLSKRDGDRLGFPVFPLNWTDPKSGEMSSGYRESGYFPEAVVNILALLGWHPSDNQEMFGMEELIQAFSLEKVSKSGAKFDVNKAFWFNQQYLNKFENTLVLDMIKSDWEVKYGVLDSEEKQEYASKIISLIKEKVQFAKQIVPSAHFFYNRPEEFDKQVVAKKWKENTSDLLQKLGTYFVANHASSAADFENQFKLYCDETGIKSGEVLQPLRVSVSGEAMGPPIFEILAMLGNQEVVNRINACVDKLSK
jgi:glutamyl-tRNA synthetase